MSRFALRISHVFLYKKVEDASVFVFWVRDRMFGEYSRRGLLCTYAKSCVLPHLCAKERIGVCVYVCVCFSVRAARRLLSSWVRRAREAGEAHRSFEVLILSRKFDPPWGKFVMLFHLSGSCTVGARGRVSFPICYRHLNTHSLVCSRLVKVTKKFVWPCCEILLSPWF